MIQPPDVLEAGDAARAIGVDVDELARLAAPGRPAPRCLAVDPCGAAEVSLSASLPAANAPR